jgi:orotate phosphoribosyltransferase-like protein
VDTAARVAALRGEGLSTAQIAAELGVSTRTVRRYAARTATTERPPEHDDQQDDQPVHVVERNVVSSTREGIPA